MSCLPEFALITRVPLGAALGSRHAITVTGARYSVLISSGPRGSLSTANKEGQPSKFQASLPNPGLKEQQGKVPSTPLPFPYSSASTWGQRSMAQWT